MNKRQMVQDMNILCNNNNITVRLQDLSFRASLILKGPIQRGIQKDLVLSLLQSGFRLQQQRQFANRRRGPRGRCCFGPHGLHRRFANQRRSS